MTWQKSIIWLCPVFSSLAFQNGKLGGTTPPISISMNIVLTEFSKVSTAGRNKELLQQCFETQKQTISAREIGGYLEKLDFPYKTIDQVDLFSVNMVGQKITKDSSKYTIFCPQCDTPIVVRVRMVPCEHYFCYSCIQYQREKFGDLKNCLLCKCELERYERVQDNLQLYSCDYPFSSHTENSPCLRHFTSEALLLEHSGNYHGQDVLPIPPKSMQ